MTKTITVSYAEYQSLKQIKQRYEIIRDFFALESFQKPVIKNPKKIIKAMKETNLYTSEFLESLGRGLQESSYLSKTK